MKLRGSNGCSGCWTSTAVARPRTVRAARGRVDHVEQLADGDGGRARRVRALVLARVGDDQPVRRRHQRVEQHLAVLRAAVAVADVRVAQHEVVAVADRLARELAVVEPEQADDAMRHGAHRDERADRQVARAEVGAGRAALEPLRQQRADLGERERGALRPGHGRLALDVVEQPLQLGALPAVAAGRGGQRVRRGGDRGGPAADGHRPPHAVDRRLQAVDELGEAAREVDRAALDVVEREHAAEQPLLLVGHRDPEQHAVQPGAPGAGRELLELERGAMGGVEPPADPRLRDPLLDARDVVVVEPEAAADGLAVGEVEHLGGGEALVGELEQAAHEAEHGVGLAQRAVGEPHAQVGRAQLLRQVVELVVLRGDLPGAEGRADQRRERLDVRAHHDHVARLERRVLGEQVQDRVAQHLDLAGAAVAGVDLDAAVLAELEPLVGRPGQRRAGRRAVLAHVGLDAREQRAGGRRRRVMVVAVGRAGR